MRTGLARWIGPLVLFFGLLYGWSATHFWAGAQGNLEASGHAIGRDFVIFWSASRAVSAGTPASIFDPERFLELLRSEMGPEFPLHFWSYPPTALFFVWPFGFEPYLSAYACWIVSTLLLLLGACWLFHPGWKLPGAMALAPSTSINLAIGQNGYLTGALVIGSWSLLKSRPWLAGVLLGLLTFKPQFGVLMPFALVAMRAWPAIVSACVTAVALAGASIVLFGLESWHAFFELTVPFQLRFMHEGTGPFQSMMPTIFMSGRLLGLPAQASWIFQWLLVLPAGWLIYATFRGAAPYRLKLAILFCATFLVCPQLMNYDMALTSIAAFVLVSDRRRLESSEVIAAGLVWILPWTVMSLNVLRLPVGPGLIAALLFLLVRRARCHTPTPGRD